MRERLIRVFRLLFEVYGFTSILVSVATIIYVLLTIWVRGGKAVFGATNPILVFEFLISGFAVFYLFVSHRRVVKKWFST